MNRVLIGSSNVYKFYTPDSFKDHNPYIMTRCTRSSTLEANLLEIEKGSIVVISVLENFIQDAVVDSGLTEADAIADASTGVVVETAIRKALDTINAAALRTAEDGNKYFLVEPINRIKPGWYAVNLDNTIRIFEDQFEAACSATNFWRIHASPMVDQSFVKDGVHLSEESGKLFVSTVLRNVEASLASVDAADAFGPEDLSRPPPLVDLHSRLALMKKRSVSFSDPESKTKKRKFDDPWAEDTSDDDKTERQADSGNVVIPTRILDAMLGDIRDNRMKIEDLEGRVMKRQIEDNKCFAALREEADFVVNKSKQDRIVIFGLTSKDPLPASKPEKIVAMKALVMTQLRKIKPDYNGSITFISHLNFSGDRIPAVECRMNSIEKAIEIRKECGRVRKADKARSNQYVFITNCVTATSRVRVDILSKISMRLNEKKIDSYCINFEPRPMMKVKHERMGWKTFHYVEAVEKFANLLKKEDIQSAHMKAASIREPIEQIFLVLKREETERTAKRDWVGKGKPTGSNAEKIADTVKTV
jgi:hypothetical protein